MRFVVNRDTKNDAARQTVSPAVTISENEREVLVEAEMPGLSKENISIETSANELVVRARRLQEEMKDYVAIHRERPLFDYERTFILSDEVDREKISAQYENGVLILRVAKAQKLQPKKIAVL